MKYTYDNTHLTRSSVYQFSTNLSQDSKYVHKRLFTVSPVFNELCPRLRVI